MATLRAKYAALAPVFTKSRRVWAAAEAQAIGYGGITLVARATGMAESTIQRGLRDLQVRHPLPPARSRRAGSGSHGGRCCTPSATAFKATSRPTRVASIRIGTRNFATLPRPFAGGNDAGSRRSRSTRRRRNWSATERCHRDGRADGHSVSGTPSLSFLTLTSKSSSNPSPFGKIPGNQILDHRIFMGEELDQMKVLSTVFVAVLTLGSTAAFAQQPTDAQIASIVVTANQVDIDAGKLAEMKGSSAEVKAFGKQMASDHAGVNASAVALVTKLKVTPEDNPTSQSLKSGGEKNVATLKGLSGAAFDKAYIANEVAYHQQVLDAVDKVLIPSAKNDDLKTLLVKVRPAFVSHLEHAKRVQASLP